MNLGRCYFIPILICSIYSFSCIPKSAVSKSTEIKNHQTLFQKDKKDTCEDYSYKCSRQCVYSSFGADSIAFIDSLEYISNKGINAFLGTAKYKKIKNFILTDSYNHDPSIEKLFDEEHSTFFEVSVFLIVIYFDTSIEFYRKSEFSIKTSYYFDNFWNEMLRRFYLEVDERNKKYLSKKYEEVKICNLKETHILFIKLLFSDLEYNYGTKDKAVIIKKELIKENFFIQYNKTYLNK